MRTLLSIIALITLSGCVSAEQRIIALAKTKCAKQIAEAPWHGTLSWTAIHYPNGAWKVDGALEPGREAGVMLITSADEDGPCGRYSVLGPVRP